MKNEIINGANYTLKPFISAEISDKYIGWLNDHEVNKYLEVRRKTQTKESVKEYIDSFYDGDEKYLWGIYTKKGKHIGTVNISIDIYNNTAELGLMIGDKSYWGQSASDEAIIMVTNFAFNALKLNRITGGCYAENIGMIFTFKKLGYRREAILKESLLKEDGQYIDSYKWAILAREWRSEC